jgi:hypothetical protein
MTVSMVIAAPQEFYCGSGRRKRYVASRNRTWRSAAPGTAAYMIPSHGAAA